MLYTPIKNKEKQVSFAEYEKDLKKRSFEGRVCYIIKIIYGEKTGQRHETIKIGFTDTLFDKECPFSGKKIRGRIYTIMSDLQRTYGYAKVVEILMVFKEHDMSSASIKRFESFLLKETKEHSFPLAGKQEYRAIEKRSEVIETCQKIANNFSDYVQLIV